MQLLSSTGEKNSNSNNNNNNSDSSDMPPQIQGNSQMLNQPPYQPLAQLNPVHWQQQTTHQPHGQLAIPSSAVTSSATTLSESSNKPIFKSTSPTYFSVGSSSQPSNITSTTSKSKKMPRSTPNSRRPALAFKGPTPEVAQQLRFPWKLHLLLERCEYEHQQKRIAAAADNSPVQDMPISWLPCGKAFKVHDKERFVQEIMPSFFGTQSFKTFQRNLNLWGFTRVSKGPQKDVCSHPLFLKGFPAVCQSMKRIVLKGTGRGNRAPLGGVDVSSVQAVVAAAAIQQAQQQQAQQEQAQHQAMSGFSGLTNEAQQVFQQQQMTSNVDMNVPSLQNTLTHVHQQNQQQLQQNSQQQQFQIEGGVIQPSPMPSQQKLVVLPSAPTTNLATTTVMWPNNINQMPQQPVNQDDVNTKLHKSLEQLSQIIQQLNGCNRMSTAAVNSNTLNSNSSSSNNGTINDSNNAINFQQQQQLQVGPSPIPTMMQQQQQQTVMQQQNQFQQTTSSNPNSVVAPSPMSTQDLVALLLQRNLQQQVSQVQSSQPQQTQPQIQLQVPSSLFPSQPLLQQQQQAQQQQAPVVVSRGTGSNPYAVNPTSFGTQQQQGTAMIGNNVNANLFSQQQHSPSLTAAPSPSSGNNQQQQQQLLQLLLQQNGWAT